MPSISHGTDWQRSTFNRIHTDLGIRANYLDKDDHYKLVDEKIFAYVKVLSQNARSAGPAGGLKIILPSEFWTKMRDDLLDGND